MRHLAPPLMLALLSGCPDRAPNPSPRLDLTRPATSPAPRAALVPMSLGSQPAFDRLEDSYLERRSPDGLLTALTMLAEVPLGQPDGTPLAEGDALLLQRLSMLHLALAEDASQRGQDPATHSQKALELARTLTDRAPSSPHALFLQGYIPFTQIGGSDRRDAFVDPSDVARKPLRDAVAARWRLLLEQSPGYHGPRGYTPERIAAAAAQIEAASALAAPHATPSAPGRAASSEEAAAIAELGRLQRSPDGVRTTACRDWMRLHPQDGDGPVAANRLTLFCATHQGDFVRALAVLAKLDTEDPGASDTCLSLARLADKVGTAALDKALVGSPLATRCSP